MGSTLLSLSLQNMRLISLTSCRPAGYPLAAEEAFRAGRRYHEPPPHARKPSSTTIGQSVASLLSPGGTTEAATNSVAFFSGSCGASDRSLRRARNTLLRPNGSLWLSVNNCGLKRRS